MVTVLHLLQKLSKAGESIRFVPRNDESRDGDISVLCECTLRCGGGGREGKQKVDSRRALAPILDILQIFQCSSQETVGHRTAVAFFPLQLNRDITTQHFLPILTLPILTTCT